MIPSKNIFSILNVILCFVGGKNYDLCSAIENENACQMKENQSALICVDGLKEPYNQESEFVSTLSLCRWPNEIFNPIDVLSFFPNIQKLALFKSGTTKILNDFPTSSTLKELNITHTSIEHLEISVFSELKYLEILDLRHNKLKIFNPNFISNLNNLQVIYLAGNPYSCGDNFSWITLENSPFINLIEDVEFMTCGGHRYNGKPLKRVMEILENLKAECRKKVPNCTCVLDHVIRVSGTNFRPMITVNCSHQHITTLPPKLPSFTSTLIMRGNNISDLSEFITNESYFKLLNVNLDYNNISSINTLLASSWLNTFRVLNLKGNHLTEVPVYALENIFEKNHNIGKFLLSENPWKCDCGYAPLFKNFLAKYRSIIRDAGNVKCAANTGDKNSLLPIMSFDLKKFCKEKRIINISFVNFLSICFAVMLVILLTDFARNYYMYKKYSKLPWIVNKWPC